VTAPVTADMTTTVVHSYKLLVSRALETIKSNARDSKVERSRQLSRTLEIVSRAHETIKSNARDK